MPATAFVHQPTIWYDQPVADRVKAMRFSAAQNDECVRYWTRLRGTSLTADYQYDRHHAQAIRLRALADEMERTGKVLA